MQEDERKWMTIIPAQPEFVLLQAWGTENEDPHFSEEPIIAWCVEIGMTKRNDPYRFVTPVTPEGDPNPDDHAIQYPDGSVRSFEATFESRDKWEAEMFLKRQKKRAANDSTSN